MMMRGPILSRRVPGNKKQVIFFYIACGVALAWNGMTIWSFGASATPQAA
jgi:hypothetical protein